MAFFIFDNVRRVLQRRLLYWEWYCGWMDVDRTFILCLAERSFPAHLWCCTWHCFGWNHSRLRALCAKALQLQIVYDPRSTNVFHLHEPFDIRRSDDKQAKVSRGNKWSNELHVVCFCLLVEVSKKIVNVMFKILKLFIAVIWQRCFSSFLLSFQHIKSSKIFRIKQQNQKYWIRKCRRNKKCFWKSWVQVLISRRKTSNVEGSDHNLIWKETETVDYHNHGNVYRQI